MLQETIAATQDTAGAAFSFSQSYTQADAVPTAAVSLGEAPNFSSVTSYAAGSAGDLAGTVYFCWCSFRDCRWSWIYGDWTIRF